MSPHVPARNKLLPDHATLQRWHFYAGLFCLPFFCWLALTGAVYLFRPQIEALLDRPYENLAPSGPRPAPSAEARAALSAVPGAIFSRYEPPATASGAAQVLVMRGGELLRVYVDPRRLNVMSVVEEDRRPMNVVSRLHGELLLGERGSTIIEIAASWGIVMIVTGLCLWWPRGRWQAAGLFYPRLGLRGRALWRELHSVTGVWISSITLLVLLSGLPWTSHWGSYLDWVRHHWQATQGAPDWPIGGADPGAHHHADVDDPTPGNLQALDRLVPLAATLNLSRPIWISPPAPETHEWAISSHDQNRPRRVTHTVDAERAEITGTQAFGDLNIVDRIVNIGIAAHEGQWFGWLNQALLLANAAGIVLIAVSAGVMWWRRRPGGRLGAPASPMVRRTPPALLALILCLALLLPLFGLTLVIVLVVEATVLRRLPAVGRWLGLVQKAQ